jgi:hypothetical protein
VPFDISESFVEKLETEIGARLPESFRQSIMRENGGEIETDDEVWFQFPIADSSDRKRLSRTSNHILKETQSAKEWRGFPQQGLAIANNGSGDYLVFLKDGSSLSAQVFIWRHESASISEIANDFCVLKAL